jgi:peptidoglycan/LPS O-acetylase OafA/YrhL
VVAGPLLTSIDANRGAPGRTKYRPHLDGLRTVAVYLVVAFHAGLADFRGGFVGVDIFFVLSGYLVTQILVRDLTAHGRIDWRRFYSRRVRRILPAAFLVLVVTALLYSVVATPLEVLNAVGGFRAAFFYVANWYFFHAATNYFAGNVNTNPVLHFWSLAVEEQFYLLWPLLLGGLYAASARAGRRRWTVLRMAVVGAAVASALEALHFAATNLDRAYYGTDTRAYQLLAGAALALTPQLFRLPGARRSRTPWSSATAAFGLGILVLLGTSVFGLGAVSRGVIVAITTSVLIVALENARGGFAKRALSLRPVTYLGRISYGTYLWHWPVIVLLDHGAHRSSLQVFAIACPLATVLAAASFHLIEHPVRISRALDGHNAQVITIGFATSILVGALVVPGILNAGGTTIAPLAASSGRASGAKLLDWKVAKHDKPAIPDCMGAPLARCTTVRGSGAHVLLIGDSDARMWVPALTEIAQRYSLTFSIAVADACPWQSGLYYPNSSSDCRTRQADWYERVVPGLHPDIVIVADRALDDPVFDPQTILPVHYTDRASYERALADVTTRSIRRLSAPAREVVLFEPTPLAAASADPLSCLSAGTPSSRCEYDANRAATPFERFLRATANHSDVWAVDVDRLACPRLPVCDPVVNDVIVKRDWSHLTATYSRTLAGPLFAILHRQHLL